MSVLVRDLTPTISRELGDTSLEIYDQTVLDSSVADGIIGLNGRGYRQQYEILGSEATAYVSPEPNESQKNLIILCSVLSLTNGEINKSARNAIVHSNIAGRTDLTSIAKFLLEIKRDLESKIDKLVDELNRASNSSTSDGETIVEGEELKSSATITASNYAEGLVRVEIITGI